MLDELSVYYLILLNFLKLLRNAINEPWFTCISVYVSHKMCLVPVLYHCLTLMTSNISDNCLPFSCEFNVMQHVIAFVFISHRALAREGDYKMHHVCACVCGWVRVWWVLVCHADFSKTTTATDFLSINCPNEF